MPEPFRSRAGSPCQPSDLASYDAIVIAFSGGKDSMACLLRLIELGVPRERIELWHHLVDGREPRAGQMLMDWACTEDYVRKVAAAFGVRCFFSWREGGFDRELRRDGTPTAPVWFETPSGLETSGGRGKPGKRGLFPQVTPDLRLRYCSPSLKIDVGRAALRNQERFFGTRTLFVTGERAEESPARAQYETFERHCADLRRSTRRPRHIDHWRPVHSWSERRVWSIIERWRVNPHPAYRLGWSRCSCAGCIFARPNQWASLRAANPQQFRGIARREAASGKTIGRKLTVTQAANRGTPYDMALSDIAAATSATFSEPVFLETWTLPRGAFGESGCGPS